MKIVFVTCISRNKSIFWPIFIEYKRLSQIACTVMIMHITSTQAVLHVHKNLCMLLIPLCRNDLNLPMCSFFFFPVLGCLLLSFIMLSCLLLLCTVLILFVCLFVFTENHFVAKPKTRHILINLKAGFHSFYFADGKNIIE